MASAFKRKRDKNRKGSRWTCAYKGVDGKWHACVGYTDKAASLEKARALEIEAGKIRRGEADPADRSRREARLVAPADHVAAYRLALLAKGNTRRHAQHTARALNDLLKDARIETVDDIALAPYRIQEALGRLKVRWSARTANFSLVALKSFCRWMEHNNRMKEVPGGIKALKPFREDADRKRVRRALTRIEVGQLLAVAAPERAWLYRLALGTGFRANELRSLTPESFRLDEDPPVIVLKGAYSKHRKEDRQEIRRDLAAALRHWLQDKKPGQPVLKVPCLTAKMLRKDLDRAEIPYETPEGRIDFHSLRVSFVTMLIESGADIKTVQHLARHANPTLTLAVYAKVRGELKTAALEGLPGMEGEK